MQYMHIFGPVASRRLGRSLGIDLVPHKVCSFDCVYCEVGRTTLKTISRQEFFPPEEVECELFTFLSSRPDLDFITFSGSGEPTLSLSIGRVIRFIKDTFPVYRVAVLTNGSLLGNGDAQDALRPADVVLPTLSTVDEETFQKIHRPVAGVSVRAIIEGLCRFRETYPGEIWLEVFLVPGLNTGDDALYALKEVIGRIRPDRVQLNTLDRPGPEPWVRAAGTGDLQRAARILGIGEEEAFLPLRYGEVHGRPPEDAQSVIIEAIRRRPGTLEDLVALTGLHRQEVIKLLRALSVDPRLKTRREARGTFYSWSGD
ncbi:MAG: radical SAM protein [Methanolinea sp.]|nr:radical SAM protein [Methanolinea sp.]